MGRIGLATRARRCASAVTCAGMLVALPSCSADEAGNDTDRSTGAGAGDVAVPAGVATTEPGSVLDLGDEATVPWRPAADLAGVVELRVDAVREADPTDFEGLVASGAAERPRAYYVDVVVANVGDTDLGGLDIPLYLLDTSDSYGPPWRFEVPFAPCRSRPLPESFAPGDTTRTCLVHVARAGATYAAIAYAPTPDVEAITWVGEPTEAVRAGRERPTLRPR